jgi:hypothetical protein
MNVRPKTLGMAGKGFGNRWLHAQRITHPVKQLFWACPLK